MGDARCFSASGPCAAVKLGRIATVTPGPGLLAFASVVVLTMLASASFKPQQIWEEVEEKSPMNEPHSSDDLPKAKTRKRKWSFSGIWVVPIVAALVAGYLVYQRVREFESTIVIRFRDVDGLKPGQTPIQYRGADIGLVDSIALSKNQQYAEVHAKLRRHASSMAREGSVFWIVRPQIGMGNLTGLGTIITGPYIAVLPGNGKAATQFKGGEYSPAMLDPNGLNVVLLTSHGGSLGWRPDNYRGIEIRAVRETRLSTNASVVEIHSVIRRPYAPLVRLGSKFWNVTGMDVRVGLFSGAEVNVESLKSLFIGGIAFATPDDGKAEPVRDGTVFRLYDKAEKEWSEWSPLVFNLKTLNRSNLKIQRPAISNFLSAIRSEYAASEMKEKK